MCKHAMIYIQRSAEMYADIISAIVNGTVSKKRNAIHKSVLIHSARPMANSSVPSIQSASTSNAISTRNLFRDSFSLARMVVMSAAKSAISTKATRKK